MDGSAPKGSAKRWFSNARLYQKTHSYSKADWLLFCNCSDNGIHAMSSAVPLSKRVEAICDLLNRAEAEAVSTRVVRKREITRMNAQMKQLLQKCTKLRSHLKTNRKEWLEMNRKITKLVEESKRATWHRHMDRTSKSKMPSRCD